MSLSRGGAVAARRAHNPKAVGSNPTPATNQLTETTPSGLFYFQGSTGKKNTQTACSGKSYLLCCSGSESVTMIVTAVPFLVISLKVSVFSLEEEPLFYRHDRILIE